MQLLAKFKKTLYMRFRATLNFRKFKVALNKMHLAVFEVRSVCRQMLNNCHSDITNNACTRYKT